MRTYAEIAREAWSPQKNGVSSQNHICLEETSRGFQAPIFASASQSYGCLNGILLRIIGWHRHAGPFASSLTADVPIGGCHADCSSLLQMTPAAVVSRSGLYP